MADTAAFALIALLLVLGLIAYGRRNKHGIED